MKPLPQSSKTVLRILGTESGPTHKDIVQRSHCSPRTVRYALKKLKEQDLIVQRMNMKDMRQIFYGNRRIPGMEPGVTDLLSVL